MRAEYVVGGLRYEVTDSFIGPPNPDFDTVRSGDTVTVYYDPDAPGHAFLSEPKGRAVNLVFAVLLTLLVPTLFVGAVAVTAPLWQRFLR